MTSAVSSRAQAAGSGRRPVTRLLGGELPRFIARRIGQAVLVLFCVATATFFLVRLTGDPVAAMLPPDATAAQANQLRTELGFNRPLIVQYLSYLNGIVHLDLGRSVYFNEPASQLIAQRFPATLELALGAMVFALIVAIPAGILAAMKRGTALDSAVVAAVLVGQSTPAFFVGILLILVFAVTLHLLPAFGMGGLSHLILPSITLGLYSMAMIARLLRSSLIDVLGEDYIRTARSKGLSKGAVIRDHALQNAALPVVTIVGLEVGSLLGGAILTEQVFAWPGVGQLTVEAITERDIPLVQAIVLFLSVIFVIVNLVVDILYAFLDPRVRLG